MKIGVFAQQYNVTIDTIRYYIKLGILLPKREGLRYIFDSLCHTNMDKIQYYKSLGFSMNEIVRLMSVQYLYNGVHRIKKDSIVTLLHDKAREVKERIRKEQAALKWLEKQINEMELEPVHNRGFSLPLSVLDILACPSCGAAFNPHNDQLTSGRLSGAVTCSCGFSMDIDRNIIYVQKGNKDFSQDNPSDFIVQFLKDGKGSEIVEAFDQMIYKAGQRFHSLDGNILYFQNLPVIPFYESKKDGFYILAANDTDYLEMVYESLCLFGGLEHFVLINAPIDQLPIRNGSIRAIYDFFYSDISAFVHKSRFLEKVVPLLHEQGDYLHIGLSLENGKQSGHTVPGLKRFNHLIAQQEFEASGFCLIESETRVTAALEKLLSASIMDRIIEQGYSVDQKDKARIYSQLFVKSAI